MVIDVSTAKYTIHERHLMFAKPSQGANLIPHASTQGWGSRVPRVSTKADSPLDKAVKGAIGGVPARTVY